MKKNEIVELIKQSAIEADEASFAWFKMAQENNDDFYYQTSQKYNHETHALLRLLDKIDDSGIHFVFDGQICITQ